jgi:hypothetical protein
MGIEPCTNSPGNTALSADGGAESGAPTPADPDLTRLVDAWPTLPPPIRAAVLALVETALHVASGTHHKAAQERA